MRKDYYVILGIASDATLEEVKSAFRRRAMELHPDTSGLESGPFLEVQEAYGVLSDAERRRRYDRRALPVVTRRRPWGPAAEPMVRARPQAEPLRAADSTNGFRKVPLADFFARPSPSFDELFDRLWSNFDSVSRPKCEGLASLTVEVVLAPEDAHLGGRVQVNIPARATCPGCGGSGAAGFYECWRCEGHGALTTEYPVLVSYPPGTRDGYAVPIPLNRFGIENLYLTVLFRVSGAW
jgi:DnaJ-class molecular chaperone